MKSAASGIFWTMVTVFGVIILGLFILHFVERHASGNVIGRSASKVESLATPRAA